MLIQTVNVVEVPALYGLEGELVLVRVVLEPRNLEELLEALAGLDFPVNPELFHRTGSVAIEFPAYERHVREVREIIESLGFQADSVHVQGMLQSATAGQGL